MEAWASHKSFKPKDQPPTGPSDPPAVSGKEAYVSGAATWPAPMMVAFGNDVDRVEALKVIGGSGNASKGDKDPAEWKPPLKSSWSSYARSWLRVKVAYDLTAEQAEVDALRAMLSTSTTPPASTPDTTGRTATAPSGDYYASCAAARAAGKAPLSRGDPGYRPALDGNSDGVACQRHATWIVQIAEGGAPPARLRLKDGTLDAEPALALAFAECGRRPG